MVPREVPRTSPRVRRLGSFRPRSTRRTPPRLGVLLAFVFGVTSLGLYTYMLPMAADRGLGTWGFALIWVWGIGGVLGSMLIGRQIDAVGSRRLLPILAAALLASFAVVAFLPQPVAWLAAVLVWGATGWASVPALQDALTRSRPEATTTIVAFQMAAMYLGSAVGSAVGTALLGGGTPAGDLPFWALGAQAVAVVLAVLVGALGRKAVLLRAVEMVDEECGIEDRHADR